MLWPDGALAHTIVAGGSGFEGGLLHPLLVPSHTISLLTLGLMIGRLDRAAQLRLIAIFMAASAIASVAIARAYAADNAETVLLAAAVAGGLLTAAGLRAPFAIVAALVLTTGIALQFDSVPATISASETLLALAGAALAATTILVAAGSVAASAWRPWQIIAIRIAGSWSAAIAALLLALALR